MIYFVLMKLNEFLKNKNRKEFAGKVGTTENYVNNLCSNSRYVPGRKLALRIEEASGGAVTIKELLYPDAK
jgi:DNA-binding transcriptional regulator YdaS (Cro superfamily)